MFETTKTNAKSITLASVKVLFKISLVVTGIAALTLSWLQTPYGTFPIVQSFGVLNIIAAVAWEFLTQKPATKKSK